MTDPTDPRKQPGIEIVRIGLSKSRFAHRAGVGDTSSSGETEHEILLATEATGNPAHWMIIAGVRTAAQSAGPYVYEVVYEAEIRADAHEPNMPVERYAREHGWSLLFPFIREMLGSLTARGRFGPVWLPPTNVAALLQASTAVNSDSDTAHA